eukprot:Nitzschia sp. Nitz4//scaffold88_size82704//67559//68893//NITZ4_005306-RA/size82704-augustus-gene-0.86-mRNA-1//-1//CDS//3329559536//93//frame0
MKFTLSAIFVALAVAPASAFAPVVPMGAALGSTRASSPASSAAGVFGVPSASASSTSLNYSVGIVGATGAVGKEIRDCLEGRGVLPVEQLRIFGSERSAGSLVDTKSHGQVKVELFSEEAARQCDLVFLAVDGSFALKHAKNICAGDDGAVVIDSSSAFRYEKDVPLVIPEINGKETKKSKLIAGPNCTTAIGLMALWPLIKLFGMKRLIMSTYQASSGAGQPGMDELKNGTRDLLDGKPVENKIFAHPLPFNVIPQIDKFQDNLYTKEEMKVTWETRKICDLADDLPISCSAVRIPTIRAHSEVIIMECDKPVDVEAARAALDAAPGVKLVDDPANLQYPMPLTATGQYDIEVGRIRKSIAFDNGLEFFVSGDQLLRGAALNAVLVAEEMNSNGSLKAK